MLSPVKSALIAFLLLFAATQGFGACHVVTANGSGSKNGADWNNAYAKLPSSLVRGDTYYLADSAKFGYGHYTFNSSGSALVTVKKAQPGDHCTDTGWNEGSMGSGQASFTGMDFAAGSGGSNITVDGNGTYAGSGCGGGPSSNDKASAAKDPSDCGIIVDDTGCTGSGGNACGFIINVSQAGGPATTGVTMRYMEWLGNFQNVAEQSFVWAWGSGIANAFVVDHLYAHNTGCTYLHQDGGKRTESNSYFWALDSNSAGCHGEATYDVNGTTVTDFNNVYRDIVGSAVHWFDGSTFANGTFYNNVYWVSVPEPSWVANSGLGLGVLSCANGSRCSNFTFNQNTMVNLQGGYEAGLDMVAGGGSCSNCQAHNNLWYGISNNIQIALNGITEDHNTFLNGKTSGGSGDIKLASGAANPFNNWQAGDFTLASQNSNWSGGVALSSPFTTDANGTPWPTDSSRDRGAFQFGSTNAGGGTQQPPPATPQPPTGLVATVQ